MYLDYFNLTDFPFIQSAKDQLFFSNRESVQHCADVHHWLDAGHGMLVIAGEQGVGRSSLACHALDSCSLPVSERYVVSSLPLSPVDLLQSLAIDMGLPLSTADAADPIRIRHAIRSHLRSRASLNRRVCIVVHNADKLTDQTLAYLEDLGKDHTLYLPLCHIVLLVDKAFARQVARQKRTMTARHIYQLIGVKPLSREDVTHYVEHRLKQAGMSSGSDALFPPSTIKIIYEQTSGKPQLINALCDISLVNSYSNGASAVGAAHIQSALRTLGWQSRLKPSAGAKRQPARRKPASRQASTQRSSNTRRQLGALEQSVHELISGVTTLGRAPDCTIRLEGADISPYQALIVRTDEGMFIRNEGNQLPLFLNGSRVVSANLSAGDALTLGSYEFVVEVDSAGTLTLVSSLENGPVTPG